jgi:membrane protease YdiL (CAAX protease family)
VLANLRFRVAGAARPQSPSGVPGTVGSGALGFVLTVAGGGVWTGLLFVNLATTPAVPWSVVLMGLLLWCTWRYLGGSWASRGTASWRRAHRRSNLLPPATIVWALLAGTFFVAALAGFWSVLFQLVKLPSNHLPDFSRYPLLTAALVLGMASLVSAVTEEVGFRGYFQVSLESRLPAAAAIVLQALLLSPAHALTQGFFWPVLLFYLLVDVSLGLTAYLTNSILPGLAIHAAGLLAFFTLVWPRDAGRRLVSSGGADTWFWVHLCQFVLFAALAVLAFASLARTRRSQRSGLGSPPPRGGA